MIVLVFTVLFATAVGKPLQNPRLPLMSNLRAPLVAELDVSNINIQLQEFIELQVEIQVNHTFRQDIAELIEPEIMKIKEFINFEMAELANGTLGNYSRELSEIKSYIIKLTALTNNSKAKINELPPISTTGISNVKPPVRNVRKMSDGKDKDFIVIFHQGYRGGFSRYVPKILVSSNKTAHLSVYYFADNRNTSVIIDKDHFEHNLAKNVLMTDGISNAGVHIHSDVSITLYGFLFQQSNYVSEGFLVIPTRYASRCFVIPTYSNFRDLSIIAITPLYPSTVVNIQLRMAGTLKYKNVQYYNNNTIQTVLTKYSTLQLSSTSDLSGTMVTASKPVIIVSGNTLTRTLSKQIRGSDAQPFMEMALPTDQLDNLFIIPQISTRSNNTVRIQAVNSTKLSLQIGNQKMTKSLKPRDHFDFYHTTVSYIHSSEDILVMIYPHELTGGNGDSFMMTIPGVNQYLPEYDFAVPTGFESFISITVPSDGVADFILDGQNINISSMFSISEGLDHFSTFSMPITSGVHRIVHSRKLRFGLWIYGNHKPLDAYGYPAGIAFRTHD